MLGIGGCAAAPCSPTKSVPLHKRSLRLNGSTTSTSEPSSRPAQASAIRRKASALTPPVKPVRVLVDECLSERVCDVLDRMRPEHEFEHVRALGWAGATNGKLQAEAHDEGFEAIITGDANMEFQTPKPPMPANPKPSRQWSNICFRFRAAIAPGSSISLRTSGAMAGPRVCPSLTPSSASAVWRPAAPVPDYPQPRR